MRSPPERGKAAGERPSRKSFDYTPAETVAPHEAGHTWNRVTGLQAALGATGGLLDGFRLQLGPADYAALVDILCRRLDRERPAAEARLRRLAA